MTEARRAVRKALPAYGRVMEALRRFQPGLAHAIETYVRALCSEAAESRAYIRDLQEQVDEQAAVIGRLQAHSPRPTPSSATQHAQLHTRAAAGALQPHRSA